ncbi:hypothetical protein [Marinomonas gallaica]|uniref:hypothetical protein n=1 Tax=Marinomonas gallaica TaxID=1806667 RepID=UPI0008297FA4|nr:hypothetical protein [Marinomonas gallaica]
MKATFGQDSWQTIIHHSDRMRVYEIQLAMNEHANHNFAFPFDSLLTVTDGQVFLESPIEETTLKANQAAWLTHNQSMRCVAVSPIARLFIIVFTNQTSRHKEKFERFASGTEHKHELGSGITHWTVENKTLGKVEWVMLPANHVEPAYYLKDSEQFILPLNHDDSLSIIYDDDRQETITESGIVIEQGRSRSLVNQANKPITFLSVTTPYPKHSRILKLKGSR